MTYIDLKVLTRRTARDKVLCDKAFNIAKNPTYDGYQCRPASIVYKFFDKKNFGGVATLVWSETLVTRNRSPVKNENVSNKGLLEQLHKPIIRKFF